MGAPSVPMAPRRRHGFYAALLGLSIFVIFGFGALAVDVSYMRMTQSQAQDVADAASQAAAVIMRRTGDPDEADRVARKVVALNRVGSRSAALIEMTFGTWAEAEGVRGVFTKNTPDPNAARVTVARQGTDAVPLILAPILGYDTFAVRASATSASRNIHVILAMDITNSWNPVNFEWARAAAVRFFDTLSFSAGPHDKVGMTVFTGRYAWEFTPLTRVRDATALGVRADWSDMKTASKGGWGDNWPARCDLKDFAQRNDFTNPNGGCYANMPREYTDEPGTDHTTGIELAATMFEEDPDPTAERVLVVLTDGIPNGIASNHGAIRAGSGYVEDRWREYKGPAPHTTSDIRYDSIQVTSDLWDAMRAHTYVVSFVQDDWFLHDMPRGQGYFTLTNDPKTLVPIFEEIANSLPMAIVE